MKKFAQQLDRDSTVVDIGCGNKPYAEYFSGKYIGVDHDPKTKADVVSDSINVPLSDSSADAVILNQTLEHVEKPAETVSEIWRLLKPGGLAIITVPLTMKVHATPLSRENAPHSDLAPSLFSQWHVDYWRFTKYGLAVLFKKYKIMELRETSGYAGTLSQSINLLFASLGILYLFSPLYFISNTVGYSLDKIAKFIALRMLGKVGVKFYNLVYISFPLNYILIVKKPYYGHLD